MRGSVCHPLTWISPVQTRGSTLHQMRIPVSSRRSHVPVRHLGPAPSVIRRSSPRCASSQQQAGLTGPTSASSRPRRPDGPRSLPGHGGGNRSVERITAVFYISCPHLGPFFQMKLFFSDLIRQKATLYSEENM